ncbi:unnamed protein product [Brassica napus]|uniref:(rape) hypothetical protein n=1 Tax=Brassica napus TaxID=3708 RepID=A0A816W1E5_BRANA|nr:unnamed protein product [Brassica napus]
MAQSIGPRLILAPPKWSRLETEVSMDAARASPCGSPCNGLRSRMLQPICKFRSGQGSNPEAGTPAGAPIPLDQSNLGRTGRAFLFSHAMNIVLGAKEDRNLLTGLTPWLTYLVLTATNRWVGSTREPTRPRKSTRKASSFSKKLRLSRRRIGSERIHYWI